MEILKVVFIPATLVAVAALTAAMGTPITLFGEKSVIEWVIQFGELLGVIYIGLKFILRPMLNDALNPIKEEQIALKASLSRLTIEQEGVTRRLTEGDQRFEEFHEVVRDIGEQVGNLSRDVAVALDRTQE